MVCEHCGSASAGIGAESMCRSCLDARECECECEECAARGVHYYHSEDGTQVCCPTTGVRGAGWTEAEIAERDPEDTLDEVRSSIDGPVRAERTDRERAASVAASDDESASTHALLLALARLVVPEHRCAAEAAVGDWRNAADPYRIRAHVRHLTSLA